MILEFIFNILMNIVSAVFSAVPDITWTCDSLVYQNAISLIQGVAYLLPTETVVSIVTFVFILMELRIVIAIVKTVWDLLPIL